MISTATNNSLENKKDNNSNNLDESSLSAEERRALYRNGEISNSVNQAVENSAIDQVEEFKKNIESLLGAMEDGTKGQINPKLIKSISELALKSYEQLNEITSDPLLKNSLKGADLLSINKLKQQLNELSTLDKEPGATLNIRSFIHSLCSSYLGIDDLLKKRIKNILNRSDLLSERANRASLVANEKPQEEEADTAA